MMSHIGTQKTLKWQIEGNANTLSRNLRKAIELADKTTTYRKYGVLANEYKLCVENSIVVAKPRRVGADSTFNVIKAKQIIDDEFNIAQLVGYLTAFSPEGEVFFPKVRLSTEDLIHLDRFCKHFNWTYTNHEEDGITLKRNV